MDLGAVNNAGQSTFGPVLPVVAARCSSQPEENSLNSLQQQPAPHVAGRFSPLLPSLTVFTAVSYEQCKDHPPGSCRTSVDASGNCVPGTTLPDCHMLPNIL